MEADTGQCRPSQRHLRVEQKNRDWDRVSLELKNNSAETKGEQWFFCLWHQTTLYFGVHVPQQTHSRAGKISLKYYFVPAEEGQNAH